MQVSEPQIEVLSGKKVPLCSFNAVGSVESTSRLGLSVNKGFSGGGC